MAPDSKTDIAAPPSAGARSTMAGMRLFGATLRKSGANWSPLPMLIGLIAYSSPLSSRNIVILCPLGVVQY
jgi:hypothetical protein